MFNLIFGLFPIIIFLISLIFLDSFKLVRLRVITGIIFTGSLTAIIAYYANTLINDYLRIETLYYSRYVAPFIEETLKASVIIYLIKSKKVGFMVDAALYGVAVGAGFAFLENSYYLLTLETDNQLIWLIRGFGTALMHGGTTAIFGVFARNLIDFSPGKNLRVYLPGLLVAVIIHSAFNHFILDPVLSTILIVIALPLIMMAIFRRSENSTREWLGKGLDSDLEIINLITTGDLTESRIGRYLYTLKTKFPPGVVGDMLCLIRIHTELSMRAKGMLIMREAGFDPPVNPEIQEKLNELKYLNKSVGKTGKLAISPILHKTDRSLWQIQLLEK